MLYTTDLNTTDWMEGCWGDCIFKCSLVSVYLYVQLHTYVTAVFMLAYFDVVRVQMHLCNTCHSHSGWSHQAKVHLVFIQSVHCQSHLQIKNVLCVYLQVTCIHFQSNLQFNCISALNVYLQITCVHYESNLWFNSFSAFRAYLQIIYVLAQAVHPLLWKKKATHTHTLSK